MAQLIVIYWRDIPAQVIGRSGRERIKRELPPRFLEAIDTAALRVGKGGSDAYLEEWRRVSRDVAGDLDAHVSAEVERLLAQFPDDVLRDAARAGGIVNAGSAVDAGGAGGAGDDAIHGPES